MAFFGVTTIAWFLANCARFWDNKPFRMEELHRSSRFK